MTTTQRPSDKQLALITKLCTERDITPSEAAADADVDLDNLTGGRFGTASKLISSLFAKARTDGQGTTRKDPEPGLYRVDDTVVRVKVSKAGNWYAEAATLPGAGRTRLSWDYLGRRVALNNAERMADDEAGKFLGYCVRCNAELTDPESIARGMGPICANKT